MCDVMSLVVVVDGCRVPEWGGRVVGVDGGVLYIYIDIYMYVGVVGVARRVSTCECVARLDRVV